MPIPPPLESGSSLGINFMEETYPEKDFIHNPSYIMLKKYNENIDSYYVFGKGQIF